ncbi:MAG: ribonuclease Z [Candidatus Cloacimonadales bacterium]|jgi:ribonuclease BN (tRNA processing enzyme)|nr:ribonuclease Z [Candidatus Cloacimonadota bacterium]MDD2650042.1 ribonuclease Z [Candidatus Cloacimonadota bacterium]MDD3501143.1 ribonuclease Z [Candidatus Cloacimonadota bacterium]MDX9978395.1 ribonuclease Z [Candidatus Cloacimonadales bacterium]
MKFKVLGSSSGFSEIGKNLSSVFVEVEGKCLIFDAGEGLSQRIQEEKLDYDTIDAIFISHYHPDHVTGLFMLIQVLYIQARTKPLHIFLPERVEEFANLLSFFYTFQKRLSFELYFLEMRTINKYYPYVKAFKNDHLLSYRKFVAKEKLPNTLSSYSFKIVEDNKSLIYTSDIQTIRSISEHLSDCVYCITDAFHPHINEIKALEHLVKEQVILTHGSTTGTNKLVKENKKYIYAEENKMYTF